MLSGTPLTFAATIGIPFNGIVANLINTNTANIASDFTATINWGDGTVSAGTISGGGKFQVTGTHTHASPSRA